MAERFRPSQEPQGIKLDSETPSGQLHFLYLSSSFLHIRRERAASSLRAYILIALPPKQKSLGEILGKDSDKSGFDHMLIMKAKAILSPVGAPLRLCGHYWSIAMTRETEYIGDGNFHLDNWGSSKGKARGRSTKLAMEESLQNQKTLSCVYYITLWTFAIIYTNVDVCIYILDRHKQYMILKSENIFPGSCALSNRYTSSGI